MSETARRNKTEKVGDLVDAILRRSDTRGGLRAATVCAAWRDVAGPAAASHSRALRVTEGELVVAVDSPAWATEMSLMKSAYLESLQARVGKESVKAIRFTVSKRVTASRDEAPGTPPAEKPRPVRADKTQADAIRKRVAAAVSDEDLREAIVRARLAFRQRSGNRTADAGPEQG